MMSNLFHLIKNDYLIYPEIETCCLRGFQTSELTPLVTNLLLPVSALLLKIVLLSYV